MNDQIGCKFVTVRFYPNLARDEFLNVGVVLHCDPNKSGQIEARFLPRFSQLKLFVPKEERVVLEGLKVILKDLELNIESESMEQNYLVQFIERFQHHIRFSEIRATLTDDPVEKIEELYDNYISIEPRERVTSKQVNRKRIKANFYRAFKECGLKDKINKDVTVEGRYIKTHHFDYQYDNGKKNLLYSISFDLENIDTAIEQIRSLRGGADDILCNNGNDTTIIAALYPPKKEEDMDIYKNAKFFLKEASCDVRDLKEEPERTIVENLAKP